MNLLENVFIEGNKEGFNSKIAIEKFKTTVKKMDKTEAKINIKELQLRVLFTRIDKQVFYIFKKDF